MSTQSVRQCPFRDRSHAGQLLAERLAAYAHARDTLVVGLPRGGVPVAAEVARRLALPLDVLTIRKIGTPWHEETAMGAIASGGVVILDEELIASLRIPTEEVEREIALEREELARREATYRSVAEPLPVEGKCVILVDDGCATGYSLLSAVEAMHRRGAASIVAAVPVASSHAVNELSAVADEVHSLCIPRTFLSVGQWYQDFSPTRNSEVVRLLRESRQRNDRPTSSRRSEAPHF